MLKKLKEEKINEKLSLILCLSFAILYTVYPIQNTIALRYFALILGLIIGLIVIITERKYLITFKV